MNRLSKAAEEDGLRLFLVGGSVRDEMLGRPIRDLDLATDAPVERIKGLIAAARPDSLFALGEKFGTVSALIGDSKVEITTFRSQHEVAPGGTLEDRLSTDLAHRDFTINAMARDLHTGEIYDPHGGQLDINQRLLKAVGDAEERFQEDPLRILRAVRIAAELDFYIDSGTRNAARKLAGLLAEVARERVGDELDKILLTDPPSRAISDLDTLGLLEYTIPEILEMHEMERGPHHYKEVYPHTLKVVDRTEPDLVLRWAALLHDIAKPSTYSITNGEVHFFGHDKFGAHMARDILVRLRRSQHLVEQVTQLVAEHLRIGVYEESWTDGAVRRFLRETAPITERLFALSRADITSQRPQRVAAALARVDALYERCKVIEAQEEVEKISSPLDGNELMQLFGGQPGPWIRQVKDYLLGLVLDGVLGQEDKEEAERLARAFMEAISDPGTT